MEAVDLAEQLSLLAKTNRFDAEQALVDPIERASLDELVLYARGLGVNGLRSLLKGCVRGSSTRRLAFMRHVQNRDKALPAAKIMQKLQVQ